jgi:hypothetical protein
LLHIATNDCFHCAPYPKHSSDYHNEQNKCCSIAHKPSRNEHGADNGTVSFLCRISGKTAIGATKTEKRWLRKCMRRTCPIRLTQAAQGGWPRFLTFLTPPGQGVPRPSRTLRRAGVKMLTQWNKNNCLGSIASRPCKGRKDGAPEISFVEEKITITEKLGHPPR